MYTRLLKPSIPNLYNLYLTFSLPGGKRWPKSEVATCIQHPTSSAKMKHMEERYNQLRSLFGSAIGADQIAFVDFCILDETGVGDLLQKVNDFGPRIKLLKLRKDPPGLLYIAPSIKKSIKLLCR